MLILKNILPTNSFFIYFFLFLFFPFNLYCGQFLFLDEEQIISFSLIVLVLILVGFSSTISFLIFGLNSRIFVFHEALRRLELLNFLILNKYFYGLKTVILSLILVQSANFFLIRMRFIKQLSSKLKRELIFLDKSHHFLSFSFLFQDFTFFGFQKRFAITFLLLSNISKFFGIKGIFLPILSCFPINQLSGEFIRVTKVLSDFSDFPSFNDTESLEDEFDDFFGNINSMAAYVSFFFFSSLLHNNGQALTYNETSSNFFPNYNIFDETGVNNNLITLETSHNLFAERTLVDFFFELTMFEDFHVSFVEFFGSLDLLLSGFDNLITESVRSQYYYVLDLLLLSDNLLVNYFDDFINANDLISSRYDQFSPFFSAFIHSLSESEESDDTAIDQFNFEQLHFREVLSANFFGLEGSEFLVDFDIHQFFFLIFFITSIGNIFGQNVAPVSFFDSFFFASSFWHSSASDKIVLEHVLKNPAIKSLEFLVQYKTDSLLTDTIEPIIVTKSLPFDSKYYYSCWGRYHYITILDFFEFDENFEAI